ncbi:hypothetical protein XENOCAPTIV_015497 [Xenoophorus captivus]|uniref:Uncharacterized protein n=1 Tax=Xenoophorus captivus TaxID=1517983 RepID=A0ABV0RZ29_9TELE
MHTLIHTPKGNLEKSVNLTGMSLDCGRKPEYPVRTYACTGRTYKLHAERPLAVNRTQDILAARQQCYQLRHRAASNKLFYVLIVKVFALSSSSFQPESLRTTGLTA